jgi:hypothetical protein
LWAIAGLFIAQELSCMLQRFHRAGCSWSAKMVTFVRRLALHYDIYRRYPLGAALGIEKRLTYMLRLERTVNIHNPLDCYHLEQLQNKSPEPLGGRGFASWFRTSML